MQNISSASKSSAFHERRGLLLAILLLLDGFMLGGIVTSFRVRDLLLEKCCSANRMELSIYNLLDYLVPYYLFFGGALIVLIAITIIVWLVTKPSR